MRKRWPDVLEVRIVEHRPFARWGDDRLLSEHGRAVPVARRAQCRTDLPLLDGPDARVADVVALYNESRALFAPGGIDVRALKLDRARQLVAAAVQRHRRASSAAARRACALTRFARLLPQLLSQKQLPLSARRPSLHQRFRAELDRRHRRAARRAAIAGKYMNRKGDKALIVGLDIGTSKVVALVGEYSPGDPIEVIGIGSHPSRGLKRGVVVNIESTVQSIQRAVEEAELMAGCEIRSVYAVDRRQPRAQPQLARHRRRSATAK